MAISSSIPGVCVRALDQGVLSDCRRLLVGVLLQSTQHDQTIAKYAARCISGTHEPFLIQRSRMHGFSNCSVVILDEILHFRYPRIYHVGDDVAGPTNDEIAV